MREVSLLHISLFSAPFLKGLLQLNATMTDKTVVRASSQQPRLYIGMVLILIFAEVLGLYGVIVGILMLTKSKENVTQCLY